MLDPDPTQTDSSHVLKNQVNATKDQEQTMLTTETHAVCSSYLDEQLLLASQENNDTHAVSTQENNDTHAVSTQENNDMHAVSTQENNDTHAVSTQENNDDVSNDSTSGEFHDASSLASVIASFLPDTAEQQSSNSTPPGYVELDYSSQAPNHQAQITGEPHSISFAIELEEDTHLECTEGLVYNVTNSAIDESVAGEFKTHDTLGISVTSIHMINKMSFHSSPVHSGYIDYSKPVFTPNTD